MSFRVITQANDVLTPVDIDVLALGLPQSLDISTDISVPAGSRIVSARATADAIQLVFLSPHGAALNEDRTIQIVGNHIIPHPLAEFVDTVEFQGVAYHVLHRGLTDTLPPVD